MLGVDLKSVLEGDIEQGSGLKPVRLRHLRTSRGLRVGDPPARVLRILGKPTWKGGSQYTPGERVWSYHWKFGTKDDGLKYTALYRFRQNKLTGIELNRDDLPG